MIWYLILIVKISAHSKAMNTTLVGCLIGFGCLSVVLIGALVLVIQRSRRRSSENKAETSAM